MCFFFIIRKKVLVRIKAVDMNTIPTLKFFYAHSKFFTITFINLIVLTIGNGEEFGIRVCFKFFSMQKQVTQIIIGMGRVINQISFIADSNDLNYIFKNLSQC